MRAGKDKRCIRYHRLFMRNEGRAKNTNVCTAKHPERTGVTLECIKTKSKKHKTRKRRRRKKKELAERRE